MFGRWGSFGGRERWVGRWVFCFSWSSLKRLHLAGLDSFLNLAFSVLVFVCGASSSRKKLNRPCFILPIGNKIDTAGVSRSHGLMALVIVAHFAPATPRLRAGNTWRGKDGFV